MTEELSVKEKKELFIEQMIEDCANTDLLLRQANEQLESAKREVTYSNVTLYAAYIHLNFPHIIAFKLTRNIPLGDELRITLYDENDVIIVCFNILKSNFASDVEEDNSHKNSDIKDFTRNFYKNTEKFPRLSACHDRKVVISELAAACSD